MSRKTDYSGHSGQMAVMAELLVRQCNVAIPDVDYGTDVFAFQDEREDVARIQVKTGRVRDENDEGYSAEFLLPMKQLRYPEDANQPGLRLYYALVARLDEGWGDFIIISRAELQELWNGARRIGTEDSPPGNLKLTVQFRSHAVTCGDVDVTVYRNAWERLPPLRPLPDVQTEGPPAEGGPP